VTASGNNVVVTFQGTPAYQEWMQDLYNMPMVPAAIWTQYNNENIFKFLNQNGVGTGPYMYKTAAQDRIVWVKNPNWWATKALGLSVQPTYIVDIVNSSNNVALGQLLSGGLDLDNNYLPGIAQIVNGGYGITTYFAGPPYMLAGNTAWLVPNTKKKPLDDPAFRKALAEAINPQNVVVKDYGNIVAAASPTGLLPVWDKYVDQNVVKTLGVSFNTAKAKADLAAAGYKVGSDGFVTNKDGSAIKLNLEVPDGWSDWMEAENLIAADAALAGININPTHPAYATVVNDRNGTSSAAPTFDLVINNDVQIGSTPWTYYDYIFRQPEIAAGPARNRNFEQYDNATAWALVQKLDQTLDVTAMQAITSQLQTIQLTDEPIIPLWYNGEWSQVNNSVWTNWPSDTTYRVQPATWNGYWQMGAIYMLTNIKPAG
jgi:peptide/nickel transport system substrate-binding protein